MHQQLQLQLCLQPGLGPLDYGGFQRNGQGHTSKAEKLADLNTSHTRLRRGYIQAPHRGVADQSLQISPADRKGSCNCPWFDVFNTIPASLSHKHASWKSSVIKPVKGPRRRHTRCEKPIRACSPQAGCRFLAGICHHSAAGSWAVTLSLREVGGWAKAGLDADGQCFPSTSVLKLLPARGAGQQALILRTKASTTHNVWTATDYCSQKRKWQFTGKTTINQRQAGSPAVAPAAILHTYENTQREHRSKLLRPG